MSIGFSPANTVREHLRKYRLPYEYFDFINYTGMAYVGRDLYLVQSSDAVVQVGGRMGSLHEFTSALESRKPVGVLLGSHGAADLIPQLMEIFEPPAHALVVYDDSPEKLVEKIIAILDKDYADLQKTMRDGKEHWYLDKLGISGVNRAG
jgi:predicted Rossmann-fold nucleotide-binding protein